MNTPENTLRDVKSQGYGIAKISKLVYNFGRVSTVGFVRMRV
jgi:hypothetical protein